MYSLTVRDKVFIAHSLKRKVFGPAQRLHGATLVVEAEFQARSLDPNGIVIDIGVAAGALHEVLSEFDYRNLDELPELRGELTTVEFLAKLIHGRISRKISPGFKGGLKITLRESPDAWASYEAGIEAQGVNPP